MTTNLQCTVRSPEGHASVIDIVGEVGTGAEPILSEAYATASEGGATVVILNFTGLEYMNSSGIGVLVTLLIRANRKGQQLCAVGLSDHYREIFELTRIDEAIAIFASEEEALSATAA